MKRPWLVVGLVAILVLLIGVWHATRTPYTRMQAESSAPYAPQRGKEYAQVAASQEDPSIFGERLSSLGYLGDGVSQQAGRARRAKGAPEADGQGALSALAANQPDRYLIKNAALSIETGDARHATAQLTQAVTDAGGYVSNLSESTDGLGRRSISLEVRVPSDKLDSALQQFDTLGKILSKQVTTQDVTEEYIDTESRSRNLKRTEERLLEHLSRTGELEDIVLVEKELTRVREQIERLDGRLRFLSHRVTFSTIQIALRESPAGGPLVPTDSFSTAQVFSEAARSLVRFAQALWVWVIWLGVWSVVWGPCAVLAWFVYRRARASASG